MTREGRSGVLLRVVLVLSLALPLLLRIGAAEAACSRPDIEHAAQQVREARQALRVLPIADSLTTDVTPDAQRTIAAMKARLGDLADADMRCAPPQADAKQLEHELLDAARGTDPDTTDEDRFGGRIDLDVQVTGGASPLVSMVASFSIHCGSDAVLFVFTPESDGWREALRWHSKDYATVAGAFWSFDYAISPRDRSGGWFVVAKSVAPWCSSTWSEIRYSVLRPKPAGVEPRRALSRIALHMVGWRRSRDTVG